MKKVKSILQLNNLFFLKKKERKKEKSGKIIDTQFC